MKNSIILTLLLLCQITFAQIHPLSLTKVSINDPFWSPKLSTWSHKTVYDVLNKLAGDYEPDRKDLIDEKQKLGRTRNAFLNFDLVAQGKKDIGTHDGPPWYDGLVYESIRGAADLLVQYPDPKLEKQIDGYITRIAAAQAADKDGYINTYTTLVNSNKRWQNERWQHDLYNAGMLVDAGIHYYYATGKTTLLTVGVRMANYIYTQMGPAPKPNIIPGHGGPEEAFLKLYELFKAHPALTTKLSAPVAPDHYLSTALFWITDRGHYTNPDGSTRETYGAYNQDQSAVFDQQTIEGHAVRATLLATGITTAALLNNDPAYIKTADNYWNNMAGKRTFITGGQGAIPEDEKFGPDYYLPESAYLETCAAVGAAFFSEKMNELKSDGKYMDEFERVIYNNLLAGVSQDGTHYFYENPLTATHRTRWTWHDCPCCPPMFLKMIGVLPQYIYGESKDGIYVNLFIGSKAKFTSMALEQTTEYPVKGRIQLRVTSADNKTIPVHIRIPGWATGKENPFDLYQSSITGKVVVKVNNQPVTVKPVNGYLTIAASWQKGDVITMDLPVAPRLVYPHPDIQELQGKVAVAAGPVIYAKESTEAIKIAPAQPTIKDMIPFYMVANKGDLPYSVWLKKQ